MATSFNTAGADTFTPPADGSDWLGQVNAYRISSGLVPVTEDPVLSAEATAAAEYMVSIGQLTHRPDPAVWTYTPAAGRSAAASNLAMTTAAEIDSSEFVDLWMAAPFHALGLLRPGWRTTGFGRYQGTPSGDDTVWTAAALDVLRGLQRTKPSQVVVFPGAGANTHLREFNTEWPNPLTWCPGYQAPTGLPIVVMLPTTPYRTTATVVDSTTGTTLESCVLTAATAIGRDQAAQTARSLLTGANGIVIVPKLPLQDGHEYVVAVNSSTNVSWTFGVDHDPPEWTRSPTISPGQTPPRGRTIPPS